MSEARHDDALTREAWEQRRERMTALLGGMLETAKELEGKRCPYKNVQDRCTAKFGCRNQRKPPEGRQSGALFVCGGDDKIDWRSAWDVA